MKFLRLFYFIPCAALLFGAVSAANADTVTGSVWAGGATSSVPVAGSGVYSTTPTDTFTVTNSNPASLFNFYSPGDASLTSFLTTGSNGLSNGDSLAFLTGTTASQTAGIDDDLFQFTGSVTLTNGNYSYEDDDGLVLYLNGVADINSPNAQSASPQTFTVCGSGCDATAGTYSFVLDYAEVDGPPAQLTTNLPLTPTPEPSSLILVGTGLIAAAGVTRRRLKA